MCAEQTKNDQPQNRHGRASGLFISAVPFACSVNTPTIHGIMKDARNTDA
jgi:hypothetical protein